jgi:signal transduction histidine kinase
MTILSRAFEAVKGEGTVTIATKIAGEGISISIKDTGPSISREQLGRIFDIRLRTRESRIEAGFGMAACNSIVSQHKGRIEVESAPGKGTTFTVVLPV